MILKKNILSYDMINILHLPVNSYFFHFFITNKGGDYRFSERPKRPLRGSGGSFPCQDTGKENLWCPE